MSTENDESEICSKWKDSGIDCEGEKRRKGRKIDQSSDLHGS